MSRPDHSKRRAGVLLPLSAVRTETGFGVGDFAALPAFFDWMKSAGLSVWNLLPLNDLAPLDSCPYSALSAFALDCMYADLQGVPEIRDSEALSRDLARAAHSPAISRRRKAKRVRFADVRAFKTAWLERAYDAFARGATPARRAGLEVFRRRQRHWLADYTLYRSLCTEQKWKSWKRWPPELRNRDAGALAEARKRLAGRLRYHAYVQWVLFEQWRHVRTEAGKRGILLYGDIPFGLSAKSADVWARQEDYNFSATMGAPPDRYSRTGQAWGLPAYRWERMEKDGHPWWRARIRHAAMLYDLFRLDHAVGFFRTYLLRRGKARNGFDITGAKAQEARGRRFFRMALEEGRPARAIAEDLGAVPKYVSKVLADLKIPGYKIALWERAGSGFRHPKDYPQLSVASTGNHDTDTLATWWAIAKKGHRNAFWRTVTGNGQPAPRFSPEVHATLLRVMYESSSALMVLPFQDLFATRERINIPGTVRNKNWTYRIPWPIEQLTAHPKTYRKSFLAAKLAQESGRT